MYDALVIGAGPAGSAAAWALATGGLRVALVDAQAFPRDKVCGDGLIPDALGAIDRMGLTAAVEAASIRLHELRVYAPDGSTVSLDGDFRCVPRIQLDDVLVSAAAGAGADVMQQRTATRPLFDGNQVAGAILKSDAGEETIRARVTLLATGANATARKAFGLRGPMKPNAIAGRAYFEVPETIASRFAHLCIVYDRALCPGYGWIFPGPDRRFNAGVGYFSTGDGPMPALRDLWDRFTTAFEPAATLVREARQLTEFRGAPLRTGLAGARFGRPGLLAIGESAATTYPATGEGIGKAMASGLVAADLFTETVRKGRSLDRLHHDYETEFRYRFVPQYQAYGVAQACTARPWLINFLVRRANTGTFVRRELEDLIAERGDPLRLLSLRGLATAAFS
jgi:geranylgeranyl reductase family protein